MSLVENFPVFLKSTANILFIVLVKLTKKKNQNMILKTCKNKKLKAKFWGLLLTPSIY